MSEGQGYSLPELLHVAGFLPDREGSGEMWEFLNEENPKITFRKGSKSVEFEKRFRRDINEQIIPGYPSEKHVKFIDTSKKETLPNMLTGASGEVLFHTSQAIWPGDAFLEDFLGINLAETEETKVRPVSKPTLNPKIQQDFSEGKKNWDPDDDEEDDDEGGHEPGEEVAPAGKTIAGNPVMDRQEKGLDEIFPPKEEAPLIVNNKKSKNGTAKKTKRKTKKRTKAKSAKRIKKESRNEQGTEAVRSNAPEESRV